MISGSKQNLAYHSSPVSSWEKVLLQVIEESMIYVGQRRKMHRDQAGSPVRLCLVKVLRERLFRLQPVFELSQHQLIVPSQKLV